VSQKIRTIDGNYSRTKLTNKKYAHEDSIKLKKTQATGSILILIIILFILGKDLYKWPKSITFK